MKKLLNLAAMSAVLMFASASHAAGSGILTQSGTVTSNATTGCSWISSDITVGLSAGVAAAYDCATSNSRAIYIGTSSSRGTTKTRTLACAVAIPGNPDATPPVPDVYNNDQCTAENVTNGDSVTVSGSFMYFASSAGGMVSEDTLGGGGAGTNCDGDDMETCANEILSRIGTIATIANSQ